jgi:hypothetical protein
MNASQPPVPGPAAGDVNPLRPTSERWISKRQAAEHLGRSTRWMELCQRDDGLPHRKVKGVCMYRRSELDAWVIAMDDGPRGTDA